MKRGVYKVLLLISLAIVIGTMIFLTFNKKSREIKHDEITNSVSDKVTFQIIQREISNKEEKIISNKDIKVGDTLTRKEDLLELETASNIKVLEVNSTTIKISREKIKYEISNETVNSSEEEIVEELEYGTTFSLSISEKEPCYPKDETCPKEEAPRYEYYGVFVKN